MDVSGKTILLTGGTSGIGRRLADQLKAKGATVITTGRNAERLEEIRGAGFEAIEADFTSAAGVEAVVTAWGDRPLDILINNAGMGTTHDFREGQTSLTDTDDSIFTNLNAPIHLITHFMDRLRASASGSGAAMIVNVTSGVAIAPSVAAATYCATKAALRSYTQSLRVQMKDFGIHVLEVLPPMVDTPMTAEFDAKKMTAEDCAATIVSAMERDKAEANVGIVSTLRIMNSISPKLAERLMLRF